ncbi:MAG: PAS domain-containing protein [Caldilineaceae bacterium]
MMPMQHSAIIRSMKDGVIVLNAQNQIVEMNPAAQRILHMQATDAEHFVGQPVEKVWPFGPCCSPICAAGQRV